MPPKSTMHVDLLMGDVWGNQGKELCHTKDNKARNRTAHSEYCNNSWNWWVQLNGWSQKCLKTPAITQNLQRSEKDARVQGHMGWVNQANFTWAYIRKEGGTKEGREREREGGREGDRKTSLKFELYLSLRYLGNISPLYKIWTSQHNHLTNAL